MAFLTSPWAMPGHGVPDGSVQGPLPHVGGGGRGAGLSLLTWRVGMVIHSIFFMAAANVKQDEAWESLCWILWLSLTWRCYCVVQQPCLLFCSCLSSHPGEFCLRNWPLDLAKSGKTLLSWFQGTFPPATNQGRVPFRSWPWEPGGRTRRLGTPLIAFGVIRSQTGGSLDPSLSSGPSSLMLLQPQVHGQEVGW